MTSLHLPRRWTRQPQQFTGVEWSNPLSDGLVYADNMAFPSVNVAANKANTTSSVGTTGAAIGPPGKAIQSNSGVFSVADNALLMTEGPVTHFILADITALDNPWGGIIAVSDGATNGCFAIQRNSGTGDLVIFRDNGQGYGFTSSVGAVVGAGLLPITAVSLARAGPMFLYTGATKRTGSFTGSAGTVAGTGVSARYFGERVNSTSFNADGRIYLHLAWNRALIDSEVVALHANPWQIFRPLSRRLYFGTETASGGFKPHFARGANQIIRTLA